MKTGFIFKFAENGKENAMAESKTGRGDYMTHGYFLVKDILLRAGGAHLSADDIYETLHKNGERIGRTTVYRQLERLLGEGVIRKSTVDGAGSCYSAVSEHCEEHYHLICTVCGKLAHLSCDHVEELIHHIRQEHGFTVDPARTTFYGLCAACARETKRKDKTPAHD